MLDFETYKVPLTPTFANDRNLDKGKLLKLLELMLIIRYTETRIAERVREKKVQTPCHLYVGHEATAVGVCEALRRTDYVFSNHRSHGHYLAKRGDLTALFAEIYCRETGCSGGRGGSMHLCEPSVGLLGSSSIVAGSLGIGLGPALASKIMKSDGVSVIFHGDCVPEEGLWHESLNFAAVNRLPVIYVLENNLYAASMPLSSRRVKDNIPEVAQAHGARVAIVDGNDVLRVYDEALGAVNRARNGEGPQFIECRTYRWLGHVGPNDDIDKGLRNKEELDFWKERCPIATFSDYLVTNMIISDFEWKEIQHSVMATVDQAEAVALSSKYPNPESLLDNVYPVGRVSQ